MDISACFAQTYAQARARFLDACAARDLTVTTLINPCKTGPNGEALALDWVRLGPPAARKVLLVQSATHGVEGYCGSGCQTALLGAPLSHALPPDTAVVLIHALNPYGFAWDRRVNEDNIDLNRNFVDHDAPYPENPDFAGLANMISPVQFDDTALKTANARLKAYAEAHGAFALQDVITRGQYTHPQAVYFGGHAPAWSNRMFRAIAEETCRMADLAVFVDIHTGLGEYGVGELIFEVPQNDPAYALGRRWWGDRVASTVEGESVSARLMGCVDHALAQAAPHAICVATALEFGTLPGHEVFRATRADNWLHIHGDPNGPEAADIKAAIRAAFYPDDDGWRRTVWDQCETVIGEALAGMAAYQDR